MRGGQQVAPRSPQKPRLSRDGSPRKPDPRNPGARARHRLPCEDPVMPLLARPSLFRRAPLERRKVVYIQYTNPGAFPPLEHSSRILADEGWQVLFLGTGHDGAEKLCFPPHPNITVRKLAFCGPG